MTATPGRAVSRMPSAAARCATIARKGAREALKTLGLVAAAIAGLLVGEWVLTMATSLPPGEWRQVVLRALAAFVGLVVFWIAYGFPRDMWRLWRSSREPQS